MTDGSSRRAIRITIDTNLFISGLIRAGTPPNLLLRTWIRGVARLVTSAAINTEIIEVLQRPKFARYQLDGQLMANVLEALAASELVEPLAEADLPLHCRDPKDDMVLACALTAQVDYIVTGDYDLQALDGHPALGSIRLTTARDLLALLGIDLYDRQSGLEREP